MPLQGEVEVEVHSSLVEMFLVVKAGLMSETCLFEQLGYRIVCVCPSYSHP